MLQTGWLIRLKSSPEHTIQQALGELGFAKPGAARGLVQSG
jgi:hypothetical protein